MPLLTATWLEMISKAIKGVSQGSADKLLCIGIHYGFVQGMCNKRIYSALLYMIIVRLYTYDGHIDLLISIVNHVQKVVFCSLS